MMWTTTCRLTRSNASKVSILPTSTRGRDAMATDVLHHTHEGAHDHGHHDAGANKVFGFWIYLMSDCILFACLFATYAVLVNGTAGGPSGKDIFELPFVFAETMLLLFSSITFGFAMLAMNKGRAAAV